MSTLESIPRVSLYLQSQTDRTHAGRQTDTDSVQFIVRLVHRNIEWNHSVVWQGQWRLFHACNQQEWIRCTVWVKKSPPYGFLAFFPNGLEFLINFSQT